MDEEVQTRSEDGDLSYFVSLKEAMEYSDLNPSVWKISFSFKGERVRLVRRDEMWVYEPIELPSTERR